jgi:hypothetical protein
MEISNMMNKNEYFIKAIEIILESMSENNSEIITKKQLVSVLNTLKKKRELSV